MQSTNVTLIETPVSNIYATRALNEIKSKKIITLNTTTSSPVVTLSSLDAADKLLNDLFAEAVSNADADAVKIIDKKELRKQRNLEKSLAKQQRMEKSSTQTKQLAVVIPEHARVSGQKIMDLRFSQDSICHKTQDGIPLENLISSMEKNGWKKGTTIAVVRMPDGELVSLDNRRLYAAKKLYETTQNDEFSMQISVFDHKDPAPKKLLSGIIAEYKKSRRQVNVDHVASNILTNSYGHCAVLRINTRMGDLDSVNFGYSTLPIVRY